MPFSLYMLALAIFVMGTSEFMISGLLPRVAADLDVSVGTAGLLTSAFAAGMVIGAPLLVLGWVVLAVGAESPVALLVLVPLMGMPSFGGGSTLISRVLYESSGAPTMGGSFVTAALNLGAVVGLVLRGPVVGGSVLVGSGPWGGMLAPVWTAVGLTGLGMTIGVVCFRALRPES